MVFNAIVLIGGIDARYEQKTEAAEQCVLHQVSLSTYVVK